MDVWSAIKADGVRQTPHLFSALFSACTVDAPSPALVEVALEAADAMQAAWAAAVQRGRVRSWDERCGRARRAGGCWPAVPVCWGSVRQHLPPAGRRRLPSHLHASALSPALPSSPFSPPPQQHADRIQRSPPLPGRRRRAAARAGRVPPHVPRRALPRRRHVSAGCVRLAARRLQALPAAQLRSACRCSLLASLSSPLIPSSPPSLSPSRLPADTTR